MTRREAREQAFLLIFEKNFTSDSIPEMIEAATEARNLVFDEFSVSLATGVCDHVPKLDQFIAPYSIKRELGRISYVSISLLRLAVYEMEYLSDIPVSVSINEAVELAKKYTSEEESSFINGILGSIARRNADDEKNGGVFPVAAEKSEEEQS